MGANMSKLPMRNLRETATSCNSRNILYMSSPLVQCLWEYVMGYTVPFLKEERKFVIKNGNRTSWIPGDCSGWAKIEPEVYCWDQFAVLAGLGGFMLNRNKSKTGIGVSVYRLNPFLLKRS